MPLLKQISGCEAIVFNGGKKKLSRAISAIDEAANPFNIALLFR